MFWTRAELKLRAKVNLGRYYWAALLVCFLTALLGGGSGGVATMGGTTNRVENAANGGTPAVPNEAMLTFMMIVLVILAVVLVIGMVLVIFVGGPVQVGEKRFFMESRDMETGNAGVGKIFYSFGGGHYWNTVKVMFLRSLFIGLWSCLFLIPGIIKAYEYCMVPYILAENPDVYYKDALAMSRDMMRGHKWNTLVLELSFFGWALLGSMLCGFGIYFVIPYIEATKAELYAVLRTTIPGDLLPGFGAQPEYAEASQSSTDYYY